MGADGIRHRGGSEEMLGIRGMRCFFFSVLFFSLLVGTLIVHVDASTQAKQPWISEPSRKSMEGDRRESLLGEIGRRVFRFGAVGEDDEPPWPKLGPGWRTGAAAVLGGAGAALSSAGGVGGGGLFVPLFNLLLLFDAKTSAALSNFMILGGSLANLGINLRQRHPRLRRKPLVDFDVVLLLQPNMLLGISTGVVLNVVLPDWAITVLLTLTLIFMALHSFKAAFRRWDKETKQNRLLQSSSAGFLPKERESGENPMVGGELSAPLLAAEDPSGGEALSLPVGTLLALAVTWLSFFAIQVLRGGSGSEGMLGIATCGWAYWLITFCQVPLALGVTLWTINQLHAAHPSKHDPEIIQEDGFELRPESCKLLAYIALMAGIMGGLLGIGGGMIINPILLSISMVPQVTAATCAAMVFFSSSMSVVQFWLMGRVPVDWAIVSFLGSALFSAMGLLLVQRAVARCNRASLIVFSVATVMAVSAALMAGFGSLGVWQQYESGDYMGFHYPC